MVNNAVYHFVISSMGVEIFLIKQITPEKGCVETVHFVLGFLKTTDQPDRPSTIDQPTTEQFLVLPSSKS